MNKLSRVINILSVGFIIIYTLAAILVSVHRYWQYEVFYYDFGIFDQAIWNVAHFRPPIIDHFVIPGKVIFADHFSPSIFLLTPIYWITDRPEALLIAQAIAVGLSAIVLYLLGKKILRYPLPAFAVTTCYLLFIGTQNALIADIHEVTFMMLPLMLTFYAIATRRQKLFWISFLITLGFKESTTLLGVAIAILIFLTNKKWRLQACIVAILSIAWGLVTTQVIIPYFYGRRYFYTPTWDTNPFMVISTLFDDPIKRKTVLFSLLSFGFFPILYPPAWPLILQDIAARFMQKDFSLRWGLGLHYSAQMAVILAFSSVMGLARVEKRIRSVLWKCAGIIFLVAFSLYLHQFKLHGPLGLSYNPAFYAHSKDFRFLDDLLSRIPKGSTVMTMNNLAPHMIHTHAVYLLRAVYDDFMPEYFVLDLRDGQNFNNFFGADIEALKLTLPNDKRYEIIYQTKEQMIYKRR